MYDLRVLDVDIGYGAPELVTGGRDGCVRLWDPRVPDPVLGLEPGAGETARDCWTVAFGNSYSDEDRCIQVFAETVPSTHQTGQSDQILDR